jgi:hypothetical protein
MEPAPTSQLSQPPNLVEDEFLQLQSIVEELETVYSDYVSGAELLWAQFKAATEEECQVRVAELRKDISDLQECKASVHSTEEQFDFACQYVTSMSQYLQRK